MTFQLCELRHCSPFGLLLYGRPADSSPQKARMRQVNVPTKRAHKRAAPATVPPPPLPDVGSQRPRIWPILAKQSLHRPLEFSQVRRGARRKFATPEGALRVANSQGGC